MSNVVAPLPELTHSSTTAPLLPLIVLIICGSHRSSAELTLFGSLLLSGAFVCQVMLGHRPHDALMTVYSPSTT